MTRAEIQVIASSICQAVAAGTGTPQLRALCTASDGLYVYDCDSVDNLVAALADEVQLLTVERDGHRRELELQAKMSGEYHRATRKTCNSIATQLAAMTAARDEACDLAEGQRKHIDARIAELRKVGPK